MTQPQHPYPWEVECGKDLHHPFEGYPDSCDECGKALTDHHFDFEHSETCPGYITDPDKVKVVLAVLEAAGRDIPCTAVVAASVHRIRMHSVEIPPLCGECNGCKVRTALANLYDKEER